MSNEWRIKKGDVQGGQSGQFLDGCEIRRKADGGYEFLAVLAQTNDPNLPVKFPQFAYKGLIWNIEANTFEFGPGADQAEGNWRNNLQTSGPPQDEGGTYTAQAGSGGMEEDGKEDAASASA